jgi:periplasmic protein TonB
MWEDTMFADSLLDSPWESRSRRGWTTLASFAAQMLAIGGLLLLPLIYTQGLPALHWIETGPVLAPPPAPPAPTPAPASAGQQSNFAGTVLVVPRSIPRNVLQVDDKGVPPPIGINGIEGGTNDRWSSNGVFNSIGNEVARFVPPPPPPMVAHHPLTSHMMEGNLVHRVQPEYPYAAKMAYIQGAVVLRAIISKEGTIENLQVVHGHPMLVKAAIDAVRQWRYRPYILNDNPVEVETEVTVNFILSPG